MSYFLLRQSLFGNQFHLSTKRFVARTPLRLSLTNSLYSRNFTLSLTRLNEKRSTSANDHNDHNEQQLLEKEIKEKHHQKFLKEEIKYEHEHEHPKPYNPHREFYRTLAKPFAKVLGITMVTYYSLIYLWEYLDKTSDKS
ncbi:hypothetical protein PACTADRAFT_33142 [Pachysolen tannophilus NRRL Y-2460]|uniref:Uncharacterized protein n=1 Tax=Pachysolen tannophilus NRRL Y-2460 TaxID=669874 RepID=A0A1E4TW35_PACTA|nr:hypothetical protein PACTADRAFT_33142 [Pachysolen tannophilus NRRL Y-2460]